MRTHLDVDAELGDVALDAVEVVGRGPVGVDEHVVARHVDDDQGLGAAPGLLDAGAQRGLPEGVGT